MKLLAKTFEGLEEVLAEEIVALGGKNVQKLTRAVLYEGDEKLMYASNYMLRTALRVLELKKEFEARDTEELYWKIYNMPWHQLIALTDTFAIDATTSGEIFTHSKFTALKSKDAIVDKIRKEKGSRPNVNVLTPTYRINIHIRDTTVTLSLDTSGESLHMRGYRITSVDAPLNEVMAAGLIKLSEWDMQSTLLDPMCGSGTVLIEAHRLATRTPPQKTDRNFGFKRWRKYNKELWQEVVSEYTPRPLSAGARIIGSDKNLRAIKVTEQNLLEAGVADEVTVSKQDFFRGDGVSDATIITNPPYDVRLREDDIYGFYARIGDKLKQECTNCDAWIFSGNIDALKSVGLKPSRKITMMNGGLEAKFYKFAIYEGTKSDK